MFDLPYILTTKPHTVLSFVNRYIPGYVFFGDGVTEGLMSSDEESNTRKPPWIGKGLQLIIGERREVLGVSEF